MIENTLAIPFPTYSNIEEIQKEKVSNVWGTKRKEITAEGEGGERPRKNQKRRKDKEVEVAKATSV